MRSNAHPYRNDTGAVVAAELHPADEGDTTTLPKTLAAAEANLEAVDVAPTAEDPAECVTDKGYHSRLVLKALDDGPVNTPSVLLFDTGNLNGAENLILTSMESHQGTQHAHRIDTVGLGPPGSAIDLQAGRVNDMIDNASLGQNTVQPEAVIAGLIT